MAAVKICIRVDVWGGEHSQDHVARYHLEPSPDAIDWGRVEADLRGGFLVNIRMLGPGEGWGPDHDFDERQAKH